MAAVLLGLGLLIGRYVLMPLVGKEAFGAVASFSKPAHDYASPFFIAFLILTLVAWMKYNFFKSHDLEWFNKVGGYLTRERCIANWCSTRRMCYLASLGSSGRFARCPPRPLRPCWALSTTKDRRR